MTDPNPFSMNALAGLPEVDREAVISRYRSRLLANGYSPKTLGWDKGKQDIRFAVLTSQYEFMDKTVLDIGCGFGDLNLTLKSRTPRYTYLGIELVSDLVEEARRRFAAPSVTFEVGDFLELVVSKPVDYAIASGIFNFKTTGAANEAFIEAIFEKAHSICRDGFAFDFLSDKVDFRHEHTFHASPEKILGLAYKFSRNVVLRNDYMPFEFSIFVRRDDSFETSDTVFSRYKQCRPVSDRDASFWSTP